MKLLFPLIAIVTAVALFFGYVNPKYQEVKALKARDAQFAEALARSKELRAIRDEKREVYNSFPPADLVRLEKMLPGNVDNIRLILDLDGIASRYGIRLSGVSFGKPEGVEAVAGAGKPYGSITVSFAVVASYETFRTFLRDLEQSLRVVDVMGLSFAASKEDLNQYSVTLRTYWLK